MLPHIVRRHPPPRRLTFSFLASAMALALGAAPVRGADLSENATLPGYTSPTVNSLSGDGSILVGRITNQSTPGYPNAARWTNGGTVIELLPLPLNTSVSTAAAISLDGSTIVGYGLVGGLTLALRWTGGKVQTLAIPGGLNGAYAYGVSSNGTYVVGAGITSSERALLWNMSNNTVTQLGLIAGYTGSAAVAVSSDGSIVAAKAITPGTRAAVWRAGSGYTLLNHPDASYSQSDVAGMSANGSRIVGHVIGPNNVAVYWNTSDNSVHTLAPLPGDVYSKSKGISADGKVIVGESGIYNLGNIPVNAFRWSEETGMQSVAQWVGNAGVTVPTGMALNSATAVNRDGSVVIGSGTRDGTPVTWLARVPVSNGDNTGGGDNGGGNNGGNTGGGSSSAGFLPDLQTFNAGVAESAGKSAHGAASSTRLTLGGAHHRSLRDSGLAVTQDGACAWATTDVAHHNQTDTTMNLVEAGACKDIGATRLGIGVGQAWSRQGWSLGGSARYNGQYVIAEAASDLGGGVEVSLLGYHGRFATDMKRNYQNGAATDTSKGTPDATSTALRLRADWKDAFALAATRFSPYAAYTWTDARVDGYTETGGGFPVRFNASTQRSQDVRLGLAAKTPLTPSTDLRVAAEAAHRIDDSGSGASGQVIGLWSFSLPGQKISQNWSRLLVDLDHRIGKSSLINLSATAATSGGDASWGASLGYRMAF